MASSTSATVRIGLIFCPKARRLRLPTSGCNAVCRSELAVRSDQRGLLALRLIRGQILAGQKRVKDALAVWEEVREQSTTMVDECRKQLDLETEEAVKSQSTMPRTGEDDEADGDNDDRDDTGSTRLNEARRRLRTALEIQHKAIFFCGNAYFSIKSDGDDDMTRHS